MQVKELTAKVFCAYAAYDRAPMRVKEGLSQMCACGVCSAESPHAG